MNLKCTLSECDLECVKYTDEGYAEEGRRRRKREELVGEELDTRKISSGVFLSISDEISAFSQPRRLLLQQLSTESSPPSLSLMR
jgi:hypothetical protein